MELEFESRSIPCLRPVVHRIVSQEESGEAIVPDSCPDVIRTAGCYGTLVLRSKECRDRSVTISGGVHVCALVVPEDESAPRAIRMYLPFTQRIDAPELSGASRIVYEGRLRSLDARLLNSRKILIRADISSKMEAYEQAELTGQTIRNCPDQVQVHKICMPMSVVSQTAEKAFAIGEELELPSGQPSALELLKWDCGAVLTEQKLIGSRAVFKGNANVRLLYLTEDQSIGRYEFTVPFSQYAELEREGDEDDLRVVLQLTGAELEPDSQESGRRFLLTLNILAQCVTQSRTELELVDDLYALSGEISAQTAPLSGRAMLDVQHLRQAVTGTATGEFVQIIDTSAWLDWPAISRENDTVRVSAPAVVTMLYYDAEKRLQVKTERMEASCETMLADGCTLVPSAEISSSVFSSPSANGADARFSVDFVLESYAEQRCNYVSAADWTKSEHPQPRPSVIIRPVAAGETLWSIAKRCRSSVSAVCAANALTEEPEAGMLLLIPRA